MKRSLVLGGLLLLLMAAGAFARSPFITIEPIRLAPSSATHYATGGGDAEQLRVRLSRIDGDPARRLTATITPSSLACTADSARGYGLRLMLSCGEDAPYARIRNAAERRRRAVVSTITTQGP